jgi:two-component system, cell cycle response regulator
VSEREAVVLVAEDSLVVRALLRAQLKERGYTVVEAADGEQALARAREARPDVILLDVDMPKRNGFDVLAALKADADLADVPVVFITGRTTAEDAVRGLDMGAHDYLRKPFEAAELTARVHAAMRTKRLQDELRALNDELARLANTDTLTGLANRRYLDEELGRLVSRAQRHGGPLAVILVDADHFKQVNDTHGHGVGDQVLIALAGRLAERLRAEDVLGRWGGEEFLVLVPDVDRRGAETLAEALRQHVAERPLETATAQVPLTLSIGWAFREESDDAEDLLRRADSALDTAKQAGRDRAVEG